MSSPTRAAARRTTLAALSTAAAAALLSISTPVAPLDEEALEGRVPTSAELVPSVEAAFPRESYRPGSVARLVSFGRAPNVTVQLFRIGPEHQRTIGNDELQGVPVTAPTRVGRLDEGDRVPLRLGSWPSGLYFARLRSSDGRVGFAPFVVRPRRLGERAVAVVLPTSTWQAYNLRDDDGDGRADSWYGDWRHLTVRLGRPYLNRGVPYNFRRYDLPFLHWLARNGHDVDVLSDSDLDRTSGALLHRAYRLIVFPGHHEYVTTHEYDSVERYRDLGGNLLFLSANNFFWRVRRHGSTIEKTEQWRDLGRPEAALIGVQYRGNDRGGHRGPWVVRRADAAPWLFAGTGLGNGMPLGSAGIEIDRTAAASPAGVRVLADVRDLFGPGFTGQMTYYETQQGARVFAAGAFTLAGSARDPLVARLLENLWRHLGEPAAS